MKTNSILYLTRKDIEYINLPMSEIIEALDKMFKEKGKAKIEMPPKIGIHTQKDAFIHAMPAYIYKLKAAGIKWISGYPTNQKKNIPYINGLLILNDTENGLPIAIMDATWITAKRTGAATAVAAKYLARKDSSSLGILACGIQGRSNLEALACLFNLKKVKAYDIYPEVAKKFAEQMKNIADIEVVSQPKDAVVDLDLVVTSGPIFRKHGLDSIVDRFEIYTDRRHRALGDVLIVCELLKQMQKDFSNQYLDSVIRNVMNQLNNNREKIS